jgi:hypothetical protein
MGKMLGVGVGETGWGGGEKAGKGAEASKAPVTLGDDGG